jgi:hypothetical protein
VIDQELAKALAGDVGDWVGVLPDYQQELLNTMLVNSEPTAVAIAWLTGTGPRDTAPFGGIRAAASLFYDRLLEQMRLLLCTGEGFDEERAQLIRDARAGRAAIVTLIATAIAPHVDAAPVVIAPVVALTLAVVSGAGVDAICDTLESMIAERRARDETSDGSPPAGQ